MSKSALIICSSLLILSGCISSHPSVEWNHPDKPQTQKIIWQEREGGYFVTTQDAQILANNIDELKAYIEKLETLIKEMEKYYE